jgi:hypothetical protein
VSFYLFPFCRPRSPSQTTESLLYYRVLYLIIPEVHRNNGACQTVYRSCALTRIRRQFVIYFCLYRGNIRKRLHADKPASLLFEFALVLVRIDHVASVIVNADHSRVRLNPTHHSGVRYFFCEIKSRDSGFQTHGQQLRALSGDGEAVIGHRADS